MAICPSQPNQNMVKASTITAMPMVMIQKDHISTLCACLLLAKRPRSMGIAYEIMVITTSTYAP